MKKLLIVLLVYSFCKLNLIAQIPEGGKKISPDLFGLFFEDINYAADGGLYAEMVQNRSFEYAPTEQPGWNPFSFWQYVSPGYSIGHVNVSTNMPIHPNNPTCVVLDVEVVGDYEQVKGVAGVGLQNSGFDGMVVRAGEGYNFSMFGKVLSSKPIDFLIRIQDPGGKVLADASLIISDNEWKKYEANLTATADCDSASLMVLAKNKGELALDMISLFPENTFKNCSNGLRADLAQLLADMQPRFVRFPGGCLVHGDGTGNMYRWKNTIGPVEQRKGQRNIWGYHQSAGLGFYEYFQFCEDIGAKPVPVLPAAVSCQNSGGTWRIGGTGQKALPIDEMPEYIQEVIDLIEWANGPVDSEWGAKRAAAGHPEPFNLEYLGVGNEDKMTPEFIERFTIIYKAVKEKYPDIKLIGTSGPFPDGEDFEKGWDLCNHLNVDVVDEHYYKGPEWFLSNMYRYDKYERNGPKVYLGEYASWGNKVYNAIVEAAYMTGFERNGDIVKMASYAPLLAKKGFTQWNTDMIFFDNVNIVPTPNYYVQKMFMTNTGDYYFDGVIEKDESDSTLAASCVMDSKTGDVILKMVNASDEIKNMTIDLSRFSLTLSDAEITLLAEDADDENTFDYVDNVVPVKIGFQADEIFIYPAGPMSLTVIRIKNNR